MPGNRSWHIEATTRQGSVLVRIKRLARANSLTPMTWARLLAGVITALAALFVAGDVGLLTAASPPPSSVQYLAACLVLSLPSLALGWVVLRKEPRNLVGTTICLFGLLPLMTLFTDSYAVVVAARPGLLPVSDVLVTLQPGSWMVLYVPAALLLLLFPTGRLPSRRWRPVVVGLFVVPVLFDLAAGMASEPFEEPFVDSRHVLGILDDTVLIVVVLPLLLGLMALLVLSAVSMIVRYRGTTDVKQRAQLKWLALGAAAVPGTLLLCWASYLLLDRADVVVVGLAATAVIIPAATAVAIVKYDLFDVDRAVSTAVTYGLVSAALLAVFTALMMLVGTSVGGSSTFAAAAATAICAAVLMPLRTRIQRPGRSAALPAAATHLRRHRGSTGSDPRRACRTGRTPRGAARGPGRACPDRRLPAAGAARSRQRARRRRTRESSRNCRGPSRTCRAGWHHDRRAIRCDQDDR